jgi:alkylation response protein AidB-like acyl-CoA dehydrogenase
MEPGLDRRQHESAALRHDRELWRPNRVQPIFGGTTEIMKEIIARSLGLQA